nr:ORF3 [Torque teno Leptonychotes weddellii virus 2]
MAFPTPNRDPSGLNTASISSSLETLSTEDPPPRVQKTSYPRLLGKTTGRSDLATKYRLAPYSKGPSHLPISCQETSTQTESSKKMLFEELLALIEQDSQPCWCQRGSDLELEDETDSEKSILSLDSSWSDEENPGGEGPPLIPPTGSMQSSPYPSQFLF